MNVDLNELTADWECPVGEISARVVVGRDGCELLQLRVELGVLQMFADDRPDGERYRGMPTVREYLKHELRVGRGVTAADWRELEREVTQFNYRRLALSNVAENALGQNDNEAARMHLRRALRDIETCLEMLRFMQLHRDEADTSPTLRPTLIFSRARLETQLYVIDGKYEDAIEQAKAGAQELDAVLAEVGFDSERRAEDPGILYLLNLERQLRDCYGVEKTLNERLEEAIEAEDFETAAQIRNELRRRQQARPPQAHGTGDPPALPPPE